MLLGLANFVRYLPVRLGHIRKLLRDPKLSRSYYPEAPHKSGPRILLENLVWLFRFQEVNTYYYTYGLDRTSHRMGDFLPYGLFRDLRNRANESFAMAGVRANYCCMLADKFVFGQYLASLGFPTPKILAIGEGSSLTWLDGRGDRPASSLTESDGELFLKELLSNCAEGVYLLQVKGGALHVKGLPAAPEEFLGRIKGKYLLQEAIRQHPTMSQLHADSVNTVRLVTVRDDGAFRPLSAVVRIGTAGHRVDNWAAGGLVCGVDLETGRLHKDAFLKPGKGTRIQRHPDGATVFEGFEIPHFHEAVAMACRLHTFFYGVHSIGWDIGLTCDGPTFIEGNDQWELAMQQAIHGGLRRRFLATLPSRRKANR